MAALQARARPVVPAVHDDDSEASSASDWRIVDPSGSPSAQGVSLPVHDGQGVFPMDESAYATAAGDSTWLIASSSTGSSSARLSFSTTSSSDAAFIKPGARRHRSSASTHATPLTEHALASVTATANVVADEAVLTSSSASEVSDGEELLSRTPQAASAGLTPRRLRIDRAGTKRRHRASGVSSHGSKRSNTDSSRSIPPPLVIGSDYTPRPHRSVAEPRPAKLFLGNVVGHVLAVDQDTLELVAGERPTPALPRAPLPRYRPSPPRRPSSTLHGLPALREHLRQELGDLSGFAATPIDSGDETEVEHGDGPRRPAQFTLRPRRVEASPPIRTLSLQSLPNLTDSIYASLPSEYLDSPSESQLARRTLSSSEAELAARLPSSYWRSLLQRLKASLESAL